MTLYPRAAQTTVARLAEAGRDSRPEQTPVPLLAEELNLNLSDLSLPLIIGAAIASGLWLLQLAVFAFVTRPKGIEPGPATMELGAEPPAVVNLLTNHCRVSPEAVPATLLDLAAHRHLDIEEYGSDETICRLRRETPEGLLPYERMVYDHLASLAVDRVVPSRALTTGSKAKSAAWLRSFGSQVLRDARSRGLVQDRWNRPMWASLRLAALAASGFILALATQAGSFEAGLVVIFAAASAGETLLHKIFGDQQPTAAGTEATARWLGVRAYLADNASFAEMPAGAVKLWDRYMAYAAAFGLARAALRTLHMGAEDDHEAWSSTGGRWHVVKVRYPRTRLIWGRPPLGGLLIGVAIGLAGAGLIWLLRQVHNAAADYSADEVARWVRLGTDIGLLAGALLVAWGARTAYIAGFDLFHKVTREGVAIRLRDYQRGEDGRDYFIALDDGSADRIKAWLVAPAIYNQVHEGDKIRALVSPRLGHVSRVEVISSVPAPETVSAPREEAPAAATAGGIIPSLVLGSLLGSSDVPDPATLVSQEDASEALGVPVAPARPLVEQRTPLGDVRGCQYESSSGDRSSVSVFAASGKVGALMTRAGFESGEAISGIGERAFMRGRAIVVESGNLLFMISLQTSNHDDATHTLAALADKAVSRLPKRAPAAAAPARVAE